MGLRRTAWGKAGVVGGLALVTTGIAWWALTEAQPPGAQETGDLTPVSDIPVPIGRPGPVEGEEPPEQEAGPAERPSLRALSGVLTRCEDSYCVNEIPLDFGPPWYLDEVAAPVDYDGDGTVGPLLDEIRGLADRSATFTVEYGHFGHVEVFAIDGAFYRAEIGPAPWAGLPTPGDAQDGRGSVDRDGPPAWVLD
jgi:hypothetical protein